MFLTLFSNSVYFRYDAKKFYIKVTEFHIPYLWDIYSPKKIYKYGEKSSTKEFLVKYDTYTEEKTQLILG
jgi:hypothetical protein